MDYTHPIRRRARLLRQLAVAASQPATQRHGVVVGAYWWVGLPNFGDDMTPWLLPRYGVVPVHRRAEEARVAGVGSILEHLPPNFDGAIWGGGLMDDHAYPLPEARILAVRGGLTAERSAPPKALRSAIRAFSPPDACDGRRLAGTSASSRTSATVECGLSGARGDTWHPGARDRRAPDCCEHRPRDRGVRRDRDHLAPRARHR